MEKASKKLIIALDDPNSINEVVEETRDFADTYKVGLSLFYAHGPKIVTDLKSMGVEVFLDLKLHDIPMQVGEALDQLIRLKPRLLTVHALGGRKMLKEVSKILNDSDIMPLAVTLLTAHNNEDAQSLGFSSIKEQVARLSLMAKDCGINSFVASAEEARQLKRLLPGCFLVCPGIRSKNLMADDQVRTMSAYDAILAGADALVVGRPITKAADKRAEARKIHEEITRAQVHLARQG